MNTGRAWQWSDRTAALICAFSSADCDDMKPTAPDASPPDPATSRFAESESITGDLAVLEQDSTHRPLEWHQLRTSGPPNSGDLPPKTSVPWPAARHGDRTSTSTAPRERK